MNQYLPIYVKFMSFWFFSFMYNVSCVYLCWVVMHYLHICAKHWEGHRNENKLPPAAPENKTADSKRWEGSQNETSRFQLCIWIEKTLSNPKSDAPTSSGPAKTPNFPGRAFQTCIYVYTYICIYTVYMYIYIWYYIILSNYIHIFTYQFSYIYIYIISFKVCMIMYCSI